MQYVSVFVKHGREIALASATRGKKEGMLHFAICILSDVQELMRHHIDNDEISDKINEEINEAKELILSVMKELEIEKYMP